MRKYDLHRVISFHSRVKAAREFSTDMPEVIAWMPPQARPGGELWSEHVSGAMTSGHRERLLLRFRKLAPKERGLLSNARCLGEGVDVPSIDGVAFIDPRRSTIDIIQALGRAIRKAPDKKVGTIVLPVFLSESDDPEQVLDESAFKHVWDVVKALRAHDDALGEELDELRRRLGARRSPPRRPSSIKLDVPMGRVGAVFVHAFDARLVERTTGSWEFWIGLLERFVDREGHARVPNEWQEDGYRLGQWVNNQRAAHQRGGLAPGRETRLAALGGWVWDAREAEWEEGFLRLLRYVKREGHAGVPRGHREDGHQLDVWVLVQRQRYRKGLLGPERRARLEALPGWVWNAREAEWEEGLARLQSFLTRERHLRVPRDHREKGFPLAQWMLVQRQIYRKGTFDPQRRARLEVLPGWTWEPHGAKWERGFAHLERFAAREGHTRVPAQFEDGDGFKLGGWVVRQRQARQSGELTEERARRLEVLPGWRWELVRTYWEVGFARLLAYVKREGGSRVPGTYVDQDGLGTTARVGPTVTA